MKRRDFITLLGGAATAWSLTARAQQPALPVIGFLSSGSPESDAPRLIPFRQGLNETGYVEGHNVAIEYRGMQGHYDLLPAFVADFVRRPVAVIVTSGSTPGALAAKAATSTIPIVFNIGTDPVQSGLVASFNRPGGNVTGISNLQGPLQAKRLELLHDLVPGAAVVAVLANPSNAPYTEYEMTEVRHAARSLGLQLDILNGSTIGEIDAAFETLAQTRPGALLIGSESFLISRHEQILALAEHHAVPAMYSNGEAARAGGLISYGPVLSEIYRQTGIYAGRILKGEKPADLPVQQSTKVELVINLKTAKALGLTVPLTLLGRADEVIE
jgi:putative tryptophan/tyrosine transport system substrate-binding protein